jgi:hypothetical protein
MNVDAATVVELTRLTTVTLAIAIGCVAIIGVVALLKAPESTTRVMLALIESGTLVRIGIATVILLAVFGLRLLDKVSAEAAIATISGVAGYLLGGQVGNIGRKTRSDDGAS